MSYICIPHIYIYIFSVYTVYIDMINTLLYVYIYPNINRIYI